jgi:HD-GYP domain-containing protein (c-di-GMP phosphodiesterase class II)
MALTKSWWLAWGAILIAPFVAFLTLQLFPSLDASFWDANAHFWAVSVTALAAAAACVILASLTESLRETRLVFLTLAFLSIAAIFSVHGLATPGHIHAEATAGLRLSSWLSIFVAGILITASVIDLPDAVEDWLRRNSFLFFGGVTLLLGMYIGLNQVTPDWLAWIPISNRALQLLATSTTLALLAFAAWRYYQAFLFARLPSQWAMVVVLVLLMEVQVSMSFGRMNGLSWWEYHVLYALAFVVLFAGWAIEWARAGSVRVIAEALSMRDAIAQLNSGHPQPIANLVDAIELKDLYTLGHVRRVASYAVLTGRELGMSATELRELALAAQMHDIGKLGVPDRILKKPARLTEEEFGIIKEHVHRGYEIAARVPALSPIADTIRLHHEQVDGSGYPFGLSGDEIPLVARIVTVVDAYDAMTSGRNYQPAISRDAAIGELRSKSGRQFDGSCVEAFVSALDRAGERDGHANGNGRVAA